MPSRLGQGAQVAGYFKMAI